MQSRNPTGNKTHSRNFNIAIVLLIAAIGISIAVQGWNSRSMNFDNTNFIDDADQFLRHGTLPDRGDVSSYWVYATPGPAWLMMPGMLVFADPRLYEVLGSGLLFIGTLAGLFLIARKCFGSGCAYIALLLYGLSEIGIFYAGSLWSVGHPFFYVWTVYFCIRWIQEKSSNYLALAILVWSTGLYVDMVLAPAAFIFPVLFLIYRPRLKFAPLFAAAAMVLLIWFPYLRLQTTRNFVDLKSIVMRQSTGHPDYRASWCNPKLVARTWNSQESLVDSPEDSADNSNSGQSLPIRLLGKLKAKIRSMYGILGEGFTFNFDQPSWMPASTVVLFLLALSTFIFVTLESFFNSKFSKTSAWEKWLSALAGAAIVLAVLFNEIVVARLLSDDGVLSSSIVLRIRLAQAVLILSGIAILFWRNQIASLLRRVSASQSSRNDSFQYASERSLFAFGIVVPWVVLLLVVEPGHANRYWWLWSFQSLAIAAAVSFIPKRLGWPRAVTWVAQGFVVLAVATNPAVVSRSQAWAGTGWP